MFELALDPSNIALPSSHDPMLLRSYIDGLLEWASLTDLEWFAPLMSKTWMGALAEENRYPFYANIEGLLHGSGIEEVDAATLSSLVSRLTDRLRELEPHFGIKDLLWGSLDWSFTNGDPVTRVRTCLEQTGLLLILGDRLGFNAVQLASPKAQGAPRPTIIASAVMVEYVTNQGQRTEFDALEGSLEAISSADNYVATLDPVDFMLLDDPAAILAAIRLEVLKRLIARDGDRAREGRFSTGPHFARSIIAHNFGADRGRLERIVRACADAAFGENPRHVHSLRAGLGPGEPQVLRGNEEAWRRKIDFDYRLHYWQAPGSPPELAAVVIHENFQIP